MSTPSPTDRPTEDAAAARTPVTLITGGSTGIGAQTVRRLLKAGHRVAATGRNPDRLTALAESLGNPPELLPLPGDAAEPDAVDACVRSTLEHFGRIDHVIANAGFSTHESVADGDPARMRAMLLTNVLGPTLLVRAALEELKRTRGRIVLLGSVAGLKNTPGNFYSVTKWAVHALAENTRMLVAEAGVRVSLIAPGKVDTPFWDSRGGTPPGPALSAENIAEGILWVLGQPAGVDVNTVTIRPTGQVN
ncbi:SDR family oxidoreductase [Streptomyces actuosus]|uniref:SDR family oxidoreductase n=1 Tax=Streptomyces actuosus TaxID=1885 RepID=A0ABS2VK09_STRAS|nr:SDR family oxidoreductase [Streptomyces actuosus]MBN0043423.1 SDR family oxidoreductase [Streptomyces actuosus]